jgi:uncharacterized protein (DUF4415 family)
MPKKRPPLTDEEGEVRELTREDFRGMRPIREVDPGMLEAVAEWRRKLGRPKAVAPKVQVGFRLAADVVESLKASGPGYNQRVEEALRKAGFGAGTLEPSAKEREAPWEKYHAAGAGFRAHGSAHARGAVKKSAAKRSAKKTAAKRTPR